MRTIDVGTFDETEQEQIYTYPEEISTLFAADLLNSLIYYLQIDPHISISVLVSNI